MAMRLLEAECKEQCDDRKLVWKETIDLTEVCGVRQLFIDSFKNSDILPDECEVLMKQGRALRVYLPYEEVCQKWKWALGIDRPRPDPLPLPSNA